MLRSPVLRLRPVPAVVSRLLLGLLAGSIAALASGAPGSSASAQDAEVGGPSIVMIVDGLRGGGRVRAGVYADESTWLGDAGVVARCTPLVRDGRAECTLQLPAAGTYAIALYHDADDDNELDRGLFGIPTEGYGFSRNAGGGLSGPSFRDAAVEVGPAQRVRSVIRARYGF